MIPLLRRLCGGVLLLLAASHAAGLSFTVSGGQIFTPGMVVLDAPQPGTPLGGGEQSSLGGYGRDAICADGKARLHAHRPRRDGQWTITTAALPGGQSERHPQHQHLSLQLRNGPQLHRHERHVAAHQRLAHVR